MLSQVLDSVIGNQHYYVLGEDDPVRVKKVCRVEEEKNV